MANDNDWNKTIYKSSDPTNGRRLAQFLSKYNFYFPVHTNTNSSSSDNDAIAPPPVKKGSEVPNLSKAWEYFEHIGLPRCFTNNEDDEAKSLNCFDAKRTNEKAEPGETSCKTMLYPVFGTQEVDLGDFGIGIGLYFSTLRYFAIMAFLAGLINIPAMTYFNSEDYSPDGREDTLSYLLRFSAICTQDSWQPCPTCTISDWDSRFPSFAKDRFKVGQASDGSDLTFIKVNNCRPGNAFGISTFVSLIFVILAVYLINYLQRKKAVVFDKNEQTSTDYSIKVKNPPSTVHDPDTWKRFFESAFPNITVNVCTIAINNQDLIRALIDRRKLLNTLENMLPREKDLDEDDLDRTANECRAVPLWKKIVCCAKSPQRIVADVNQKETEIVKHVAALRETCEVTSVFVTFDTEESQRTVLEGLSVAKRDEKKMNQDKLFKYEQGDEQIGRVLRVMEPDEPSSIRWEDLDDSWVHQVALQIFTMIVTFGLIAGSTYIIALVEKERLEYTALTISLMSVITPMIVGYLMTFESHNNESSRTSSRYLKITALRWVITVIIPLFITPFANTLDNEMVISNIYAVFISALFIPALQLVDIMGTLNRHVLGPRAEDQRRMNLCFTGTSYNIGERYTDVSKILFLTLFYSVLFPMGFFIASIIFTVYYWMDKFCILRSWKQGPKLGVAVSSTSAFFFKLCLLTYAVMASYFYSQFPSDNACLSNNGEDVTAYTGSVDPGGKMFTTEPVQGYQFCDMELLRSGEFPALPSLQNGGNWMTPNQETYSKMFGWTSVAMLVLVLISLFKKIFMNYVYPIFYSPYQRPTYENNELYENVKEISAYVPQVKIPGFTFPFLLCDTTDINTDHVGWTDPDTSFSDGAHNLSFDASSVITRRGGNISSDSPIFSIVKSYKEREDEHTRSRHMT